MTMAGIPTRISERRVNQIPLRPPRQNFSDSEAYYTQRDAQYEPAARTQVVTNHPDEFIALLTGGHIPSEEEALEIKNRNKGQYDSWKENLLRESLSKSEVAQLLKIDEISLEERVKQGTILAVLEGAEYRFPHWQLDEDGQVLAGLSEVLAVLNVSPLAKTSWFVTNNPYLEGCTPLQALQAGEVERLVVIARGVGVS